MPIDRQATIRVSDSATMHLMFAGMESYFVKNFGSGVAQTINKPVKTAGLLFGSISKLNEMDYYIVDHISNDKYARGTHSKVSLNEKVTEVKSDILRRRWPHIALIGDYHTHPYTSDTDAKRDKGWEFSPGDYRSYQDWSPQQWPGRCALVLTIAKLKRVHNNKRVDVETKDTNVVLWQIGDFRYWVSAYIIDVISEKSAPYYAVSPRKKKETEPYRSDVFLDIPTIN